MWEWNNYLGEEALENGIRANISSFTRHHPNVMLTKAKVTGNYANSVLAKTESVRLGFEEAILLDPQGYVAECTGENIFTVRDGVHLSPRPPSAILEGITRDALDHPGWRPGLSRSSNSRSPATSSTAPTRCLCAAPRPSASGCVRSISA